MTKKSNKSKSKTKKSTTTTKPSGDDQSRRSATSARSRTQIIKEDEDTTTITSPANNGQGQTMTMTTPTTTTTTTTTAATFTTTTLPCCGRRRHGNSPIRCCGVKLSRRLKQPGFVLSLTTATALCCFSIGVLFGSVVVVLSIYHLRINPEDFTARHSTVAEYAVEVASETYGALFDSSTRTCYGGPYGNKPFSEHDGEYEDLSRTSIVYEVEEWYPKPKSDYQEIEMFRSRFFGNVLVIDNEIMITEKDEKHYHEMISHVPLSYLPRAKRVLIIGGGDGGTLLQVLKHSNLESVVIIELDPAVVKTSRQYFPLLSVAYDDARVHLIHMNGAKYVAEYVGERYDDHNDHVLDSAVESVLGDGDERIRATRRPNIVSHHHHHQKKAVPLNKAVPLKEKRSDVIDFSKFTMFDIVVSQFSQFL